MTEQFDSFSRIPGYLAGSKGIFSVLNSLNAFVDYSGQFDFAVVCLFVDNNCQIYLPSSFCERVVTMERKKFLPRLSLKSASSHLRSSRSFNADDSLYDAVLVKENAFCELIFPFYEDAVLKGTINLVSLGDIEVEEAERVELAGLLTASGELVVNCLDQKNILKDLWWEFNDYQVYHHISKSIYQALDRDEIFSTIASALKGIIGFDRISISLLSDDKTMLQVCHLETKEKPKASKGTFLPVEGSYVGKVVTTGSPLVINDISSLEDKLYSVALLDENIKSYLSLPLITGENTLGVISLASCRSNCYSDDDVKFMEKITPQIAHSFHHSHLYHESTKRYVQMKIIADISKFAAETSDFSVLSEKVVRTLRSDFYHNSEVSIFTINKENDAFELSAFSSEKRKKAFSQEFFHDISTGILGKVYRDGSTYFSNNTAEDKYYIAREGFDVVSELCVPLIADGEVLGLIDIGSVERDNFHSGDVEFLETLSSHLSQLLHNKMILEEIQAERDVFSKIVTASQTITSTLDYRKTFDAIASNALDIIGGDSCRIYILDDDGETLKPIVAHKAEHEQKIISATARLGEGLIGSVAAEGKIEIVNNAQNDSRAVQIPGTPLDNQHFMISSLKYQNKVVGAMAVIRKEETPFNEDELDVFTVFSGVASNVLANSKLHDEIEAKRKFMETLLESCPDAITVNDSDGLFTFFSKGAEEIFGYSQEDILGKPVYEYYEGGKDTAREIAEILEREGKITNYSTNIKCSDGKIIPIDLSASLLRSDDGELMGAVAVSKDMRQRVELENKLLELSIRDELTGLFNYRHFHNVIFSEINRAERQRRFLSLILFDLDGFKEYNDEFGHLSGDEALRDVGEILAKSIRDNVDSAFRYGGDEFTLILPDVDIDVGYKISSRLGEKISDHFDGKITISAGIVEYDFICSAEEFVQKADTAMYEAKKSGGNSTVKIEG